MRPTTYHESHRGDVLQSPESLRLVAANRRSQLSREAPLHTFRLMQSTRNPETYTNPIPIANTPRNAAHECLDSIQAST